MTYLALDPGEATIGLAEASNEIVATHYKTLRFKNQSEIKALLFAEIDKLNPSKIIIGNPLNMNGTSGERTNFSKNLKALINEHYPEICVILWDERLSTKMALNIYKALNLKNITFKMIKDELSAQVILQSYLDSL